MLDTTSDDALFTDKFTDKHVKRIVDPKPTKPTVPCTRASTRSSKPMSTSIVDLILLEESSRAKQSKTGSVIKLTNCNKNWSVEV